MLSDAEWRKRLSEEAYAVLRHETTEQPYTSTLLNEKRTGFLHLRRLRSTSVFVPCQVQ